MVQEVSAQSMRTFIVIWVGQFVSLIGSGLTGFALGVWVFMRTDSILQFTLIAFSGAVPGLVVAPFAGALVDRWDRRKAMILSDSGSALCTLAVAVLLFTDNLEVHYIYVVTAINSIFGAFQWPAYAAATTLLVPKRHLARASGMVNTAEAASRILSPAIAGMLIMVIEVWGVLIIDFATFLFAVTTLLAVRIPRPETTTEGKKGKGSLLKEASYGWTYIRARPGLFDLLLFFAGINISYAAFSVLFTPMILSFASPAVLGTVESVGGVGMLVGGVTLSAWGGPKRRVNGVIGFASLLGAAVVLSGLQPNALLIAGASFVVSFTVPLVNGCSQAIWQTKTAPDVQGRVFSVRAMIAHSMIPVTYIFAGELAESVFEPLMAVNGALAQSVGAVIGVGSGRGIGLLFVVMGIFMMIVAVVSFSYPRLRFVEDELPDMVAENHRDS